MSPYFYPESDGLNISTFPESMKGQDTILYDLDGAWKECLEDEKVNDGFGLVLFCLW
jgi:hypothetical protein